MECKDLIIDGLNRVEEDLKAALEGLTAEQLAFRPPEHANSVAWLAWHLTRVEDDHISELAGTPQAWVAAGWHARFGKPADPADTGFVYKAEAVAKIRPDGPEILVEYYDAVHKRSLDYLNKLTDVDM